MWNRISPSWNEEMTIRDIGINCFIYGDNIDIISVGKKGKLMYLSSDSIALKFKKIKGATTGVNPYNFTVFDTRPLFAVGTKVYSIHREDGDFPYAIVCEYTAPGTIYSIMATTDKLLVSYGTGCANLGATYATATIETPQSEEEKDKQTTDVEVVYESIGSGGSIGIETSIDGGAYDAPHTVIVDTINKLVHFNGGLVKANSVQARITLSGALVKIKAIKLV